jgi:hypothetical protein
MSSAPKTGFDWTLYADATFAGLSLLIPFPLVDWLFESFFRRRMLASIARRRGQTLSPAVVQALNTGTGSCLGSCMSLPVTLTVGLIKRLSRKILYVLTIKDASDSLNYYWHRAFLIDYMLEAGHLDHPESAARAQQAMEQVLSQTRGPMAQLAQQVVGSTRHIFSTLRRARRGKEDAVAEEARSTLRSHWADIEPYLRTVAAQYNEAYQRLLVQQATVREL